MKGSITKNFRWEEFERSNKAAELGIDNTIPDNTVAENINALVFNVLQPLRDACGHPLRVNSGYRSKARNKAVKGAANSQHTRGEAADIHDDNPFTLAWLVLHIGLPFDQLDNLSRILLRTAVAIFLIAAAIRICTHSCKPTTDGTSIEHKADTVRIRDTIHIPKPVYITSKIIDTMTVLVQATDTLWLHDTLYVNLPREQRTYSDSTYTA